MDTSHAAAYAINTVDVYYSYAHGLWKSCSSPPQVGGYPLELYEKQKKHYTVFKFND